MSESRCLPGREDVLEVLVLLLVELAEHPLAQHLGEADDRVQRRAQLVRHVGEELRLVLAGGFELAALLLDLAERSLELACPLLDLLLEACVGLLEPRRHPVELLGQRAELVGTRDIDPLVERAAAHPRGRCLHRLDRPGHPPGEDEARPDGKGEEEDQEQGRPLDRRVEGRERFALRLLDKHPPAESVDLLEGAQHLRPSLSRPDVAEPDSGAAPSSAARTCGRSAKLVRLRTRLTSGWATSRPRRSIA